jgi:hypothetical protein
MHIILRHKTRTMKCATRIPSDVSTCFIVYLVSLYLPGRIHSCILYSCSNVNWCRVAGWRLKMSVFWDVAPCSLVDIDRSFRGSYCLHHQVESLQRIGHRFCSILKRSDSHTHLLWAEHSLFMSRHWGLSIGVFHIFYIGHAYIEIHLLNWNQWMFHYKMSINTVLKLKLSLFRLILLCFVCFYVYTCVLTCRSILRCWSRQCTFMPPLNL